MDEQRAWIRSRRRKRLRIVAVILCMCLLVTTRADILETLPTFASEWKDNTVYVSGFVELPEEVRAQTVPLGTGIEELSLPDTLEAFAETPEEEDKPEDADKPGEGGGDTEKPDDGKGGTENPGDETGETGNPDDGGDGTENPGDGNGETGNPGGGEGGTENPGDGSGDSGNADDGTGGAGESGGGSDDGSGDAGNANEGNNGEGEPETQNDSAPADDEAGAEVADEMAKGADGALTVQHSVFVMPVYLSEPVATAEPQTMERKKESVMIKGVTWQSEPAYDGNVEGTYVFTVVLPEGYALAEGVSLPQITVTVQGTDPVVQELLARIAAMPEAEEYLADEPNVEAEDEYEAWMDELSTYTAEALDLWEMYETLTEEQRAQVPTEALVKLAAWVELAGQLAESSMVMAAADGWQAIENSNLKWKLEGTTLTISGTGAMPDWESNTVPWKDQRKSMKHAVIENGVSNIGKYAFFSCELDSVSIPNSVTSIHQYAFWASTITSVTIPNSMTSIEQYSFQGCDSLTSVAIPESVTSIGQNAFNGCDALVSVVIPGNVTSIGYHAFGYCTALTSVEFKGTATIPTLRESFAGSPCAEDGVKGISIPTCKYLVVKGWSEYKDHVTKTHTLTHTAEKPATCEATGTKEYWTCSECNTKFSDAAGTTVITAPVTIPATGHNLQYQAYDENGMIKESCSNSGCDHKSTVLFATKQDAPYTFTGNAIEPYKVVRSGETWRGTTSPSISYENNVEVGTATATLSAGGKSVSKTFDIVQKSLEDASVRVSLSATSSEYTGSAITPTVTVEDGSRTLVKDTDYTVSYKNNTAVGTAAITITGKGNYKGTRTEQFTIAPKSLALEATWVTATLGTDSRQYTGQPIEPALVQVTFRDKTLTPGTDYTVSYQNNIDAGSDAQVIITGQGNYTGTCTKTFKIEPKQLTDAAVTAALPSTSYQYTGQAITPVVTVRDSAIGGGTALVKDRDYTVAYADNTAVGTNMAKVTVTGIGNYTGVRTLTFTIQDKAPEVSGDDLDFSGGTVKLPDDIKDKVEKGEVEIYGSDGKKITPKDDGSLPVEPGTTIKIKYPGSDKEIEIQIPPRPAAPAPVDKEKIEKTDTTIKVPKPNDGAVYEYVLVEKGKDPDWNRSNTTGEFTGLDPNKEYDLYMRKQATEDSFASEPVKTEIRTSVTIKEPEISGAGGDNDVSEGKPSADGDSVTYTGTCEEGSTPVIIVGGKEVVPKITWDADGKKGTWSYTVPVKDGDSAVGIRVEFKDRVYKGLEIEPGSLSIHADNAANQSAEKLLDYLKAHCAVKLAYNNGTSDDATNGAVYTVSGDFNAKGAVYKYAVEAGGDTSKTGAITLTVNPVHADVKNPDTLTRTKQSGGYTKAEVNAWLPASVTVSYTGADGYAQRTENRPVTWDTDGLGTGFGAAAGSKTISGTVDMPVWATGQNTASIAIVFADRRTLTDDQMQLSVSGWAYGTQTAPVPKGSVAVTDTEQTYTYSYSANGGASWVTAAGLPKSASGHIIPGGYLAKMTYTGRGYTGTKTTSFTVVQKPVTAEKGTLAVENRNYDGTTKATLKAGGKPALVGALANDDVSLSGTLNAVFTNKGPKKDIPVTVTGFALTGRDAGYYKLVNTTLTLKATINNKDGSSPSGGSSSGSSGNTSGGDSGNSGNTGTGGNKGTGGNTGSNGGTTGTGNGTTGGTGKGSTGSGNITGTGKGDTGGTGKGSTGSGNITGTGKGTSGTGKGSTGSGKATGTGKGTSGTGKGGTDKGTSGTGSGSTAGNRMIGNGGTGSGVIGGNGNATTGSGKDSTGSGSGAGGNTDSGTGNGDAGAQQAGDGQQTKSVTVQTVQAAADDGRIVISGETEVPVAIGTLTEDAPGATRLLVGEGTVTVTVVCEDDQYTVGMNDATAVANAVLTPEQIQRVDTGESLEIRVDIKNISQSIPPEDRETVEKGYEAYEKYLPELTRGGYVDISVYMKTGEDGWNAVSETTEPLEVVIGIPEGLRGDGREYYIIRAHEGKYTLLNDMDAMPETITIVTDMFSSYAIAYREADAVDAGNGEHVLPRFLGIVSLICLPAVVAGIIVVIIVLRRKKSCK